jgi:peroxiredoxin
MSDSLTRLRPGDPFPALTVALPGGGTLELPGALAGHFGVVLLLRGAWCPYCNGQLRAFARAQVGLAAVNAQIVALSVDDEVTTMDLVAKHRLTFPVGYGADPYAVAEATGAFVNPGPPYLQSTGFVLGRDGGVLLSVYSSGAIGRLVPEDVVGLLRYVREHPPAQ